MGTLYIVATPIGNMQDITIRAIKTLFSVDIIYAEDPAKTKNLLRKIHQEYPSLALEDVPRILSLNEYEEVFKIPEIISVIDSGNNVAYVSSAGTPLISDPGYKLVIEARKRGVTVTPIPGANAITTLLSAAGLPTDKFLFLGFPPKKKNKRSLLFQDLATTTHNTTIVLYESPHRVRETLEIMRDTFGDIPIVIGRELTKMHEEIILHSITEALDTFINPKGEFTIAFNLT